MICYPLKIKKKKKKKNRKRKENLSLTGFIDLGDTDINTRTLKRKKI